MVALTAVLGLTLLLLALAAAGRAAPRIVPPATTALCLAALAATLLAPTVATLAGPVAFGIDGLSSAMLAATFLYGAAARPGPVRLALLAIAMLAADGITLTLALAAFAFTHRPRTPLLAAAGCIAAAMLLLGGLDPRFAAMRAAAPDGIRATAILVAALAATAFLFRTGPLGALLAVDLLGRILLDLCGPVTPGWWGVPVLAFALAAIHAAWRAAAVPDLLESGSHSGTAALAVAAMALGTALLARGADLLPLAALGVAAALLQVLAWSLWGGLLAAASRRCAEAAGGPELARMGGLLRRMPATGLALLIALLSMAAMPATAGFAAGWTVLQSVLAASRAGGPAVALLAAAATAALGLAAALLASAALRLGGAVLLGTARTARAAAAAEPRHRAALAALAALLLVAGAAPALLVPLVQPGTRLLATTAVQGLDLLALTPVLAALLAAALALAIWCTKAQPGRAQAWQGGFIEDHIGRPNTGHTPALPTTRVPWPQAALATLALALAATLGWALR